MNYATDSDLYVGWAEAVVHGRLLPAAGAPLQRRKHLQAAVGSGAITHLDGLDRLLAEYGDAVAAVDLLPVGTPRRDLALHRDRRRAGHRPAP